MEIEDQFGADFRQIMNDVKLLIKTYHQLENQDQELCHSPLDIMRGFKASLKTRLSTWLRRQRRWNKSFKVLVYLFKSVSIWPNKLDTCPSKDKDDISFHETKPIKILFTIKLNRKN